MAPLARMSFFAQALVYLSATVVAVPLSKRLGLGAVLGYLVAGAIIGPFGAGVISDVESPLHVAELGVVLLLFIIGLELQPSRLIAKAASVFKLGGAQVALTTGLLALAGLVLGLDARAAAVAAFGLSLSSTAFALQLLAEKNRLTTDYGQAAFGILLFQDLAVIPLLAFLPMLSGTGGGAAGWWQALRIVGVLVLVVLLGRLALRPVFKMVANARSQEVFTATALLVVLATAALVNAAGGSMPLGAFVAGVLLAESEYRHELEADIEPFKGLLLGLFFIAVGMSLELRLVLEQPLVVLGLVVGLVAAKALVLWLIGRKWLGTNASALDLALVISQGGEFAFVLFKMARDHAILDGATAGLLTVVVGISMTATPLLLAAYDRWVRPRLGRRDERPFDVAPEGEPPVIIAGFGRVGQVVGRVLAAKRIPFTAMDASTEQIDFIQRFGAKVFYGDASRLDMLRAARADRAKVFVLAIDDVETSMRTAETVIRHYPHLTLVARARNRQHAYRLLDLGVKHVLRETLASSIEMTDDVLRALGLSEEETRRATTRFREHDARMLAETYTYRADIPKLEQVSKNARAELERLFDEDAIERSELERSQASEPPTTSTPS